MSKKKGLYEKLNTSVADQSTQARDKFDTADLVVAMSRLKQQRPEQAPMEAPQVTAAEQLQPAAPALRYEPCQLRCICGAGNTHCKRERSSTQCAPGVRPGAH